MKKVYFIALLVTAIATMTIIAPMLSAALNAINQVSSALQ